MTSDGADLLERPIVCALATRRPDGALQVNPMWFRYRDGVVRFSHTNRRAKYRNLQQDPTMTVLIVDPDDEQRYVELRGVLEDAAPDPGGAFHLELARHYGDDHGHVPDAEHRVVLTMRVLSESYRSP